MVGLSILPARTFRCPAVIEEWKAGMATSPFRRGIIPPDDVPKLKRWALSKSSAPARRRRRRSNSCGAWWPNERDAGQAVEAALGGDRRALARLLSAGGKTGTGRRGQGGRFPFRPSFPRPANPAQGPANNSVRANSTRAANPRAAGERSNPLVGQSWAPGVSRPTRPPGLPIVAVDPTQSLLRRGFARRPPADA